MCRELPAWQGGHSAGGGRGHGRGRLRGRVDSRHGGTAGVSVAALYYHFPSKHDLLREFLDEAYDVVARPHRPAHGRREGPVAQLEEIVGTMIWSNMHDDVRAAGGLRRLPASTPGSTRPTARDRSEAQGAARPRRRRRERRRCCEELQDHRPREAARAIVTLAQSTVGVLPRDRTARSTRSSSCTRASPSP